MKIYYLLTLIGMSYILAGTDTFAALRAIDYNTRYDVDMSQFSWGYLPAGFLYFF